MGSKLSKSFLCIRKNNGEDKKHVEENYHCDKEVKQQTSLIRRGDFDDTIVNTPDKEDQISPKMATKRNNSAEIRPQFINETSMQRGNSRISKREELRVYESETRFRELRLSGHAHDIDDEVNQESVNFRSRSRVDYSHQPSYRISSFNDLDILESTEMETGTKVFTMLQAACKGDLNGLQRLFHDGCDMGSADYDGRRALHLAAAEGHLDCIKFLIETCSVPHSPRDRWFHTPLDEAKSFKHDAVIKYLEDYIYKTEEQEKGAKTFLLLNSACRGDIKTLKRLYQEGVDMKLADYDGRTCLHLASAEGHLEVVQFLVEQCEIPHSPKDRWYHTPLDEARNAKHTKVADFLEEFVLRANEKSAGAAVFSVLNSACNGDVKSLQRMAHEGTDMQIADYDGRTALHLAAAEGHIDVVKFLLEKCKVSHSPKDRWQHTPLDEARNAKNDPVIKYLDMYIQNVKTKHFTADQKTK